MNTWKRHRFPPDIISYAVWLHYRFNLSHRDIEDLLAERGIIVSREAALLALTVARMSLCQLLIQCRRCRFIDRDAGSLPAPRSSPCGARWMV
jgi:hypothetical protein